MTDRELLELAAKAAGMAVEYDPYASPSGDDDWFITDEGYGWNPLTDDGDALRLAVKLNIFVTPDSAGQSYANSVYETINDHDSVYVATRRAIVRAAAEIGRRMQHE